MGGKFLKAAAYAGLALLLTLSACQGVVGYDDRRAAAVIGLEPAEGAQP